MSSDQEITGVIKNAVWDVHYPIVWGYIFDDVRGRFLDNTAIHTSEVLSAEFGDKPEFIQTRHSYYRVEWAGAS